jgi:nuclease S1
MNRLLLALWLAAVPPVYSWGVTGHSLVARLAAARLTPSAAAAVARILGPDATLSGISSWADEIRNERRETGPWHYVDIQITDAHLDMQRDCADSNCVLAKIKEFEGILKDQTAAPEKRKEALMFLVHFIGDMHQPLHCADHHDKGGNDVKLTFFDRQTNLHSLWDSGLIARMGPEDALFTELNQNLTPKRTKKFAKGKLKSWAEQSHREAQLVVYGDLPKAQPGTSITIAEAYQESAAPVVKEQLERAGARLAKVLNSSLK